MITFSGSVIFVVISLEPMIDISKKHPFLASTEFAVSLIANLAAYDLPAIEAAIDENNTGLTLADCFPPPTDYGYSQLTDASEWSINILENDQFSFLLDIKIPFDDEEKEFTYVRFKMMYSDKNLVIKLWETLPHENPRISLKDLHARPSSIWPPSRTK